jgi:hypothetical protein
MFDLGCSRARNVASIVKTPLLFAVSIVQAHNGVPHRTAAAGAVEGPKRYKVIYEEQDVHKLWR